MTVSLSLLLMIIGMGLVTYIPRMLPLVALNTENWPERAKKMLSRVPYAVLGALIFPGILNAHDNVFFSIIGGLVAVVLAYVGLPLIVVVGGAIASLATLIYFF